MKMEEFYDKIDDYLKDKLSVEDKSAFEAAMNTNQELADEVELNRDINSVLFDKKFSDFEDNLTQLMDDEWKDEAAEKTEAKVVSMRRTIVSIAASLVLLLGAIWALDLIPGSNPPNGQELFAAHFSEPNEAKLPIGIRGRDDVEADRKELWVSLENAFVEKDYNSANQILEQFNSFELSEDEQNRWTFNKGLIELANKNAESAISYFEKLKDSPFFGEEANWNLGLAYLLKGDFASAKNYLSKISPEAPKNILDASKEILKKLN